MNLTLSLSKNTIIELLPPAKTASSILERVLWVDHPRDVVIVIRIKDRKALPCHKNYSEIIQSIQTESALLRTTDPFAYLAGLPEEYKETHFKRANNVLNIIKPLTMDQPNIYFAKERGRIIQAAIAEHSVTKMFLYHHIRNYWQRGMCLEALFPDFYNCGAPASNKRCGKWDECENRRCSSGERCPSEAKRGRPKKLLVLDPEYRGVNVNEADRKIFKVAIRLYYCKDAAFPLQKAYDEMNAKHYATGRKTEFGEVVPVLAPAYLRPTFEQFRYWHEKEKDLVAESKARQGVRKTEMNCRPLLGNSTDMAAGPGSIYMIDATIGDITLVSQLDRKIIGRPIIYFVIDVFSRMVVGFHICLYGPSWEGAAMAIANAATNKIDYCSHYDIEIKEEDWCCHHLSESIIADRGEMISNASESLVDFLNISVANCSPYRPDWKGIVERYFRTTNETVLHWLPGDTRKRDFGDRDNRLNATLDIKQLAKLIIYSIIEHNNNRRINNYPMGLDMIAAGVEPIPRELWAWGIENRVGRLREEPRQSVICKLLPRTKSTVTSQGVRSELGLHYSLPQAIELQWFEHARTSGTWQVETVIAPHHLDEAYLIARNGTITPCSLLPRDTRFKDLCCEELEDYNATQGLKSDLHEGIQQQGRSDTITLSESVIAEATAQTKRALLQNPPLSKRSRLTNIKENRSAESDLLRGKTVCKEVPLPQEAAPPHTSFTDMLLDKIISTCPVPK